MPVSNVFLVTLVLCLLAVPSSAAAGGLPAGTCSGDPAVSHEFTVDVAGQPARGRYALPDATPNTLVVFAHGYSHRVEGWIPRLSRVAAVNRVLTVAMNYRGLIDLPPDAGGVPRSRGYPVKAGAEDLNAAARQLLASCPSIRNVVLLGTSMGGNVSGMALAARPERADGSPLYDYWVGVEGAFNLIELYQGSRAVAQVSEFAANAKADIEKETGGTPETHPDAYRERTIVLRSSDIAAAGLKGVWLIHGIEDGLAPYDNGLQLTRLLRQGGVPTDLVTVTRRGADDDPDTTLSGYAGLTTGLAGHGGEISEKHAVIDQAFARLHALLSTTEPRPCGRDFVYDGLPRTISPDPAAASVRCPSAGVLSAPRAPGTRDCVDITRPIISRVAASIGRTRRLTISGTVSDHACDVAGTVTRVDVAVSRTLARRRCAVLDARGREKRLRRCARRPTIRLRGGRSFRLRLPGPRRRGHYAIRVTVRDAAGNARARKLRVRIR